MSALVDETSRVRSIALELRGPIGGYFVWEEALGGPLLLLAGGSGVVPLRAMLRHRAELPVPRCALLDRRESPLDCA